MNTDGRTGHIVYGLAALLLLCATTAACLHALAPESLKEVFGGVIIALGWYHVPRPGEPRNQVSLTSVSVETPPPDGDRVKG